jgi:AAA family ATP:ADP antiporter
MSKTAERILQSFVEIREGEIGKTLLMSLFFFLVIFSLTVVKPVRNSLFLSELGASKLPYVYLATAAFTGILVLIDSKLSTILNRVTFMSTTIGHGFGLHDHLVLLLNDASISVQQVAIESAGKVLHNEFVDILITKLGNPRLRKAARHALANYGNPILPRLIRVLNDPEENIQIRKSIPRVLCQIKSEESLEVLFENLEHQNTIIRHEIIKALNKIRKLCADLEFEQEKICPILMSEIRDHYTKLNIFHAYGRKDRLFIDVREVDDILYPALQEKLHESLDRIFRLLALIYPQQDIYNSFYFLTQGSQDEKSNALEYLDNILPGELKVALLPILDDIPLNHRVRQGRALFDLNKLDRKAALSALLQDGDIWLEVCTIYSLGRERIQEMADEVQERLHSADPVLRETAENYFRTIGAEHECR